jgi:outer membrane protein
MRLLLQVAVLGAYLGASGVALADDAAGSATQGSGWWQLRARGVYLHPSSSALDYTTISGAAYPEVSAEWSVGSSWSAELAVATPTNFSLQSGGEAIRIMANTLTAKYLFAPTPAFGPYLGVGLHYTSLSLVRGGVDSIDGSSVGWVAQAGMDVNIGGSWFANADVRYLGRLEPSGRLAGAPRAAKIDPTLIGIGISYRWH